MHLPFTATQFVEVFARYNAAIGLVPLLAYALAAASVYLAIKPRAWSDRFIGLSLAGMWAFTGIAYHLMSFSAINPGGEVVRRHVHRPGGPLRDQLRCAAGSGSHSTCASSALAWDS